MKVAIIVACDLFTQHSYGGKQCALSHITILEELFGKENVKVFAFTSVWPLPDKMKKENIVVYPIPKTQLGTAILALQRRKVMSGKRERLLLKDIEKFSPDLLWIDSSQLGRILNKTWNIPTIVFFHNIEQLYAKNKVEHEGVLYLPSYWASKYNETVATKKATACICLSARDGALLEKLYRRHADMMLPICMEDKLSKNIIKEDKEEHGGKNLLFVGSKFPPNVQGITWFVENVMPKLPECTLTIVGKGFEELKEQLTRKNVIVIGGVDSLDPYYENAAAVVMPILYGDGMKVKTAEAMMYGKVIFASEEALVGYDIDGVQGIFCCKTEKDFVDEIRQNVIGELVPHYQKSVRECFLDNYELQKQKDSLEVKIQKLINKE